MSDPRDREIAELRETLASERRRLERELDFARRIQLNLMPATPPQPAGWEIATAYRAARLVGGDFYDAFELPGPGGRIGLIIADVTGKGLTAALMMAFTRAVHRSAAYNGTSPADWLERTNRVLVRDARTGLLVTAIAAEVDPSRGSLCYASAGHEPALLARRATGLVAELPAGGMLLGLAAAAATADREVPFEPGDLALFYTDGVTDALDAEGRRFGAERLAATVASVGGLAAPTAVAEVLAAVDQFVGSAEPADDLTLVAVRRMP